MPGRDAVKSEDSGGSSSAGSYAHTPLPLTPSAALASAELPFSETDFGAALEEATRLVPAFRTAPRGRHLNGVFVMTPDELPLVGPAAGLRLLVCAVARSAGELLADPRRFTVRGCPSRDCGWLFLDESGRRRWCSLATCGAKRSAGGR